MATKEEILDAIAEHDRARAERAAEGLRGEASASPPPRPWPRSPPRRPPVAVAAPPPRRRRTSSTSSSPPPATRRSRSSRRSRSLTSLGLKEAKDLVDGAPKPVLEKASKEDAEKAKGPARGAPAPPSSSSSPPEGRRGHPPRSLTDRGRAAYPLAQRDPSPGTGPGFAAWLVGLLLTAPAL